jgi:hypothetical protein
MAGQESKTLFSSERFHPGLGWFMCGMAAGMGASLIWAGLKGGFLLFAVSLLFLVVLIEKRVQHHLAAIGGFLAAVDVFVISLWLSPPCDVATISPRQLPDGSIELACEPQSGMGLMALGSLVGTLVIIGLLYVVVRERRRHAASIGAEGPPPSRLRTVEAACVAVAIAASLTATIPVMRLNAWSPTALVRMGSADPIAELALRADPSFKIFAPEAHYDGVYFYAIGVDPLATGEAHELLDLGAHRYTHPLYGWLAWALSFGQTRLVPSALLAINVIAMGVAAAGCTRLARSFGMSPWWGLAVALNPGLIASVSFDTAEPLGAAILLLAMSAWFRGRTLVGGLGLFLVCMTRQPFVVIPIGLAIWEIVKNRRVLPSSKLLSRLGILATGPVAMALWHVYLFGQFGEWPFETGDLVLAFPFEGWAGALRMSAELGGLQFAQIGLASLPLLVVSLTLALIATSRAIYFRSQTAAIYLGLMVIYFCLERLAIVFPKELLRFSAIPWLLTPFVFLLGDRAKRAIPETRLG